MYSFRVRMPMMRNIPGLTDVRAGERERIFRGDEAAGLGSPKESGSIQRVGNMLKALVVCCALVCSGVALVGCGGSGETKDGDHACADCQKAGDGKMCAECQKASWAEASKNCAECKKTPDKMCAACQKKMCEAHAQACADCKKMGEGKKCAACEKASKSADCAECKKMADGKMCAECEKKSK